MLPMCPNQHTAVRATSQANEWQRIANGTHNYAVDLASCKNK